MYNNLWNNIPINHIDGGWGNVALINDWNTGTVQDTTMTQTPPPLSPPRPVILTDE